jgi:hypothetical protein
MDGIAAVPAGGCACSACPVFSHDMNTVGPSCTSGYPGDVSRSRVARKADMVVASAMSAKNRLHITRLQVGFGFSEVRQDRIGGIDDRS